MNPDQQQFAFDFGEEPSSKESHSLAPKKGKSKRAASTKSKTTKPSTKRARQLASAESALSVADVTAQIKSVVESSLSAMWVCGEITDVSRPRSGHLYFTLKDERAQLRGVMWRSVAERLPFDVDDGQKVLCFGDIEVYAARGSVQMVVRKCQPEGIGPLQLAFAQLQNKLAAEGLFDPVRKQTLPRIPRRIAIVTSPTSAAIRDFLQAAGARHAGVEIVVIPASVQGPGSVEAMIDGMRTAHRLNPRPDVLIVSRGGGSLEDLWSFNDERFVRALAACKIPTVSAVGHEIDVTLSDLVADVRALTPTDAASRVLPDRDALVAVLDSLRDSMRRSLYRHTERSRQRLEWIRSRPVFQNPHELIQDRSRLIDEWDLRSRGAVWKSWQQAQSRLQTAAASVSALSPLSVLARGYSVTQSAQGDVIRTLDQTEDGQRIVTRIADGTLTSEIIRRDEADKS